MRNRQFRNGAGVTGTHRTRTVPRIIGTAVFYSETGQFWAVGTVDNSRPIQEREEEELIVVLLAVGAL
jgi:hypothetical protein